MQDKKYSNDLIHEISPYLLQHAHNPVDWHAWNEENLDAAKKLGKPIIISIGYSACHWCHVMEKECFEDSEVANVMNNLFYCIKVDREERPDVDEVYMRALNLITGSGGWPLNCFALPNGKPFHGATYVPKDNWLNLLNAVNREFQNNRAKLEEYAAKLEEGIAQNHLKMSSKEKTFDFNLALDQWSQKFDPDFGGENRAPKFPMPSNLNFLMSYGKLTNNQKILKHIELTLDKMAQGAIYDHLAGGFCRYSTDLFWKIPHFEKMLYDNAQLLSIYSKAYKLFKNPFYKQIAKEISNFLLNDFRAQNNLFYSALDADSEGVEGKFYVWTLNELKQILGKDFIKAKQVFDLDKGGYWEHENWVLLLNDEVIQSTDLQKERIEIQEILNNHRKQRITPGLDDKCLTSWNALTVVGLLDYSEIANDESIGNEALKTLNFLNSEMKTENGLFHINKGSKKQIQGLLEDYSVLIYANIKAFQFTSTKNYLDIAISLCQEAIYLFYDSSKGLFSLSAKGKKDVIISTTDFYDNVIPSANSQMFANLALLKKLYFNAEFNDIHLKLEKLIGANLDQSISFLSNWSNQLFKSQSSSSIELVIMGPDSKAMAKEINQNFLPYVEVFFSEEPQNDILPFENRYKDEQTLFYICKNNACQSPIRHLSEVKEQLSFIDNQ